MADAPSSLDVTWMYWVAGAFAAALFLFILVVARKGRRTPGDYVFKASRLSKGNRLLPAQVAITRDSITFHQPQWIGKVEKSIHIAHISSIKIDTSLIFSDVLIETTGGHHPIVCHGHTKGDAVRIKQIVERLQSERYAKPTDTSIKN